MVNLNEYSKCIRECGIYNYAKVIKNRMSENYNVYYGQGLNLFHKFCLKKVKTKDDYKILYSSFRLGIKIGEGSPYNNEIMKYQLLLS